MGLDELTDCHDKASLPPGTASTNGDGNLASELKQFKLSLQQLLNDRQQTLTNTLLRVENELRLIREQQDELRLAVARVENAVTALTEKGTEEPQQASSLGSDVPDGLQRFVSVTSATCSAERSLSTQSSIITVTDGPSKRNLKAVIKDVEKNYVNLDKTDSKQLVKKMESIIDILTKKMKEMDPLFNDLYNRIIYTGSYYEGLRTTEATEFDLDMVIRFPNYMSDDIQILEEKDGQGSEIPPGYGKLVLKKALESHSYNNTKWTTSLHQKMKNWFSADNVLMVTPVFQWVYGVLDTALKQLQLEAVEGFVNKMDGSTPDVQVKNRHRSGPALTVPIFVDGGSREISVDLVPVVHANNMKFEDFRSTRKGDLFKKKKASVAGKDTAVLVPKEYLPNDKKGIEQNNKVWRIAFPEIEKEIMNGHEFGCLKPMIRLFKVIRDKQNWSFIASYYIKVFYLWQIERDHPDLSNWNEAHKDVLLKKMLQEFRECMATKKLNHFFFSKFNMIGGMKQSTENVVRRLDRLLKELETNPESLVAVFEPKPPKVVTSSQ